MTYPQGFIDEVMKANKELDDYKISVPMWWEKVQALRKKYGLPLEVEA